MTHSFIQQLFISTYYVPITVIGAGEKAVRNKKNKKHKHLDPARAHILAGSCHSGPEGAGPSRLPPWYLRGTSPLAASDLSTIAQNPHPTWQTTLLLPWDHPGSWACTAGPLRQLLAVTCRRLPGRVKGPSLLPRATERLEHSCSADTTEQRSARVGTALHSD